MLWDKSGRYLPAVEREKQLLFFVLSYVAQVGIISLFFIQIVEFKTAKQLKL